MAAKAYKRWKLAKQNGRYMSEFKTPTNPHHVVIDESLAEIYNSNTQDSGVLYEIDQEATILLEKDINKRMQERIARQTRTTYNPDLIKPKVVEPIKEEEENETPDQLKYNKRKEKMIAAGWVFNIETNSFTRKDEVVKAEDLLNMANTNYGKLIKQ